MVWFPHKKWRTNAWHIKDDKHRQRGLLYVQYEPEYDGIGAETGSGHLMVWERWPSFGHGQPSERMPEKDALELMAQLEEDCDRQYPRANDRRYDGVYRQLGYEYHEIPYYKTHPRVTPPPQNARTNTDDRTWRTEAYHVEERAFGGTVKFNTFLEIRPHSDPAQDANGLCELVTWRIGEKSTYCAARETSVKGAMESIAHFEYEHREREKSPNYNQETMILPPEYHKAKDYHLHPFNHPEDVTVGKQVKPLKSFTLKPKNG